MNINISKINLNPQKLPVAYRTITPPSFKASDDRKNIVSVYGDSPIRTNPAQLSLFALHDFHGQDIRMERAYSIIEEYDKIWHNRNKNSDFDLSVKRLKMLEFKYQNLLALLEL